MKLAKIGTTNLVLAENKKNHINWRYNKENEIGRKALQAANAGVLTAKTKT